jgi:hypothetical protein
LDNEASAALKSLFTENDVEHQLVTLHCHIENAAQRAIKTFKENYVSGLSSADPDFPLYLWDRLLSQSETTLSLLRTSRQHPQLSAAAYFHDMKDINKQILLRQEQRRTWATRGQHGYSLGPAMRHNRCQNVYISSMAIEIIIDSLDFFPHISPMPQLSSTDRLFMSHARQLEMTQLQHYPR